MKNHSTRALSTDTKQQAFVRFQRRTKEGFIEFLFGIGNDRGADIDLGVGIDNTDLVVELILPEAAYYEFCKINNVVHLTQEEEKQQDHELQKWQFGAPGITE